MSKGVGVIDGGFLTEELPSQVRREAGGIGPAIAGTLVITGFATLLAVPLGVLAAVYMHEYGGSRPLATFVRFLSNVMAGVPSIVMGLFIFAIFVLPRTGGFSGLAGAMALGRLNNVVLPPDVMTARGYSGTGNYTGSEWAGATFEPKNGSWMFANIQSPGITFAITGPWRQGAL